MKYLIQDDRKEIAEYSDEPIRRPPEKWQKAIHNKFYGKIKRSASHVRSGNGEKKAIWMAPTKESGYYEVQAYVSDAGLPIPFWRPKNDEEEKLYHFKVFHDNGEEVVPVNVRNYKSDWVSLGEYYFTGDSARIELSNRSKVKAVIADAVKLIHDN